MKAQARIRSQNFTTFVMKTNKRATNATLRILIFFGPIAMTTFAQPPDDKNVLLQIEQGWNLALKHKDVPWFEQNLADDLTDTSSGNGALHSKVEDIAALKKDKTVYDSLELSNLQVRIEGNAGIVTGVNHLKGKDENGEPFEVKLSFTDTYIKRNGRWLVWASQHTRLRQ
jgi:ketosteroid isomerase-like protein